MIVDLDQLDLDDRAGVSLLFGEVVESGAEVTFPLPVEGRITVTRAGGVTWVRGEVSTGVTLTCGRCDRPFAHRLVGAFREGYRPGQEEAGEEKRPARGGAAVVLPLAGSQLDVTEVVRQHLLMALPMAPTCRPECRGLCPTCGADRNEVRCGCAAEEEDPRLEALRRFRPATE
ncbi:MAG: DUF177 domain-containing protein [Armatimonadetes bacterium]|nr:DUF177 domain-containing protein [Armatimonadota bacterium]